MTIMKFRQLIDMAIGFPEPGNVNFSALHCLLTCMAEKLGIIDEMIDYVNSETETICFSNKISNHDELEKSRLLGGTNPSEEKLNTEQNEHLTESKEEILNADITPEEAPLISETPPTFVDEQVSQQKKPAIEVPSPTNSKPSIKDHTKSMSPQLSVHKLNERISKMEMTVQQISLPREFTLGIAIMKDQLEFVMEQILLLTFLTLSKKPDSHQIQILYSMAQTLREFKKENIYIEKSNRIQLPSLPTLNWQSSGLQLDEDLSENDLLEAHNTSTRHDANVALPAFQDNLEGHLCYSPEKLLDQLMELKREFCLLTNKVNEVSSHLLQQESQQTIALISEIQEQLRDHKLTAINFKENQIRMDGRLSNNQSSIESMKKSIEEIFTEKVDKSELEIQLANKVDYDQLQRKASLDQLQELQCRIDQKCTDMLRQINENDKKFQQTVDNLNNTLGFAAIEGILKTFKENIAKDVQELRELLKNYIESTNDDCAAAGARIKVLQDLACLSCDTTCNMRTMEKAKVAKLPSAHASNILSPLITYELGSIRKSGIMGYYRKDEFPHSTNAWLSRQSTGMTDLKQCVPRHAGGQHTTNNARERVEKMMSYRK